MSTIYDIAKKAKVAPSTVSRAINDETRHRLSAVTLNRIDYLVKKMNYAPHLAARSLTKACYYTLGVLIPHLEGLFLTDFFCKLLAGISDGLMGSSYKLKLVMFKKNIEDWKNYDFKSAEGVDGILILHWPLFFKRKEDLENIPLPFVVINDPERNIKVRFISGDNYEGGRLAAKHLLEKGHRQIAVVQGEKWCSDNRLRLSGFKAELKKHGVTLDSTRILRADFDRNKAASLFESFLRQDQNITAVFCLNDHMAWGVFDAMAKLGLTCPRDISVVGYDDDRESQYKNPPLTTIRVPLYEMGKQAAKELAEVIGSKDKAKRFTGWNLLPVEFVERESVKDVS